MRDRIKICVTCFTPVTLSSQKNQALKATFGINKAGKIKLE